MKSKPYANPREVMYKSRKSYNAFLGQLSKALDSSKGGKKRSVGSKKGLRDSSTTKFRSKFTKKKQGGYVNMENIL